MSQITKIQKDDDKRVCVAVCMNCERRYINEEIVHHIYNGGEFIGYNVYILDHACPVCHDEGHGVSVSYIEAMWMPNNPSEIIM